MAFYRPNNTIDRNGTQITETDTPNWYSDKSGSYTQIGAIVPTLVNAYTDTTDVPDQSWTSIEYDHHYAQRGFLYCDGGQYKIKDYPLLYDIIRNDYLNNTDLLTANSNQWDTPGTEGTIFRTFINQSDVYAEIYKDTFVPLNGSVVRSRAYPNESILRFVGDLKDYPSGGTTPPTFEEDKDYKLEYNESYQSLASRNDTDVYRFLVNAATTSETTTTVAWMLNSTSLALVPGEDNPIITEQYYGTVPELVPGTFDPLTGQAYPSGYDSYPDAKNWSPDLQWGNIAGIPDSIDVVSWEILLEDLSLDTSTDNYVQWHIKNIPANVTSIAANGEVPTGAQIQGNTVSQSSSLQPAQGAIADWIRDNGYSGPQPDDGEKHLYRFHVVCNLSNNQTLVNHLDFTAGNGTFIDPPTNSTPEYTDNFVIDGVSSNVTNTVFNVEMSTLADHPTIRIRKAFRWEDYPNFVGKFRVPDYRDRKIIGYGEGVEGPGTPLVGNRPTIKVGDTGGEWVISRDKIDDPQEFFTISDVLTTGYDDVNTSISPYLTGSKKITIGPIVDYIANRPPEHKHQLLTSEPNETRPSSLGGIDSFTSGYQKVKGNVEVFVPDTSDGFPLGHSHGLVESAPQSSLTSTYGNSEGIGNKIEDTNNPGCFLYSITEPPVQQLTSIASDGTKLTVVTVEDHGLSVGDWVVIAGAGTGYDGNWQIESSGFSANGFELIPTDADGTNIAPVAGTGTAGATVREASGYFEDVTGIPDPKVWVVDDNAKIGGKPIYSYDPGDYEVKYEHEQTSPGNFSYSAAQATDKVRVFTVQLFAPGGGGGSYSNNGTNGGTAAITFTLDGTQYTVSCSGGQGGVAGISGGDGGNGGVVSIPAALLSNSKFTVMSQNTGQSGTDAPSGSSSANPLGGDGGGGDAAYEAGAGGDGGYSSTPSSGYYDENRTSNGSYTPSQDNRLDANASVTTVEIDVSGGAGGDGNSNTSSGCPGIAGSTGTGLGGDGGRGRRIKVTTGDLGQYNIIIGTKGGDGFEIATTGVENPNNNVGTGAANGGGGGRGALGAGATAGAGGGATGVSVTGALGYIVGAGGGGGAGAGGGGNNWAGLIDKCWTGGPGLNPDNSAYGLAVVGFDNGVGGGQRGCTAGGGGGGGGGAGSGGDGGAGGVAGSGHYNTGSGTGGKAGRCAWKTGVANLVLEGEGSTGNGYVNFRVNYSGNTTNPSGGGAGAGAGLSFEIQGENIQTAMNGVLGSAGNPGAGGGNSNEEATGGEEGYIKVVANAIIPGAETVLDYTTPAGRVYDVPGYPDSPTWPATGGTLGGAVWHSSSEDVNIFPAGAGTNNADGFVAASTQATKHVLFRGTDDRWIQIGPLNMKSAEKLVFNVIKGNGSNGGESPDGGQDLQLFYKTDPDPAITPSLIQQIAPTSVSASGWTEYEIDLDESHPARRTPVYLYVMQDRQGNQDDDDWGLAEFGIVYGEVSNRVFTPASNSTLPGNNGTCGPNSGIDVVRKTITAAQSNIRFDQGTLTLSTSTPISVTGTATVEDVIPLITRYHRAKYLIKAF